MFTWSELNKQVKDLIKTCHKYQICKKTGKKTGKKNYGLLLPKNAKSIQWNRVNIDLWEPKLVVNVNSFTSELHAMAIVDSVTGWFQQL